MPSRIGSLVAAARAQISHERTRRELEAHAPGIRVHRTAEVRSPDRLRLGRDTTIESGALLHCGGMEWSGGGGGITIGAGSYVGPNVVLFGAGGIEIGENVLISPGVVITSHQHTFERSDETIRAQPMDFGRVVIERDVWIGANASILPGTRLGEGTVVGAGATVTRDLPPGSVALGVPARVVRER